MNGFTVVIVITDIVWIWYNISMCNPATPAHLPANSAKSCNVGLPYNSPLMWVDFNAERIYVQGVEGKPLPFI